MLTDREFYFWISLTEGMTARRLAVLETHFPTHCELIEKFSTSAALIKKIVGEETYLAARDLLNEDELRAKICFLEEKNIRFVTPSDTLFPSGVSDMTYDQPPVLYYAGNEKLFSRHGLAIVGTRRASAYGLRMTGKLIEGIKGSGLTVVSGLADGIDTAAHEAALKNGIPTMAVLGSGISHVTPTANTSLARKIAREGGLIVSEFAPGFLGSRYSYPQRNRLIAAMSEAVVMVEGSEKSGALYTVDHAVEQGKEIFLLPGNVDSRNTGGIIKAYREGKGNFIFSSQDVLEALHILLPENKADDQSLQLDIDSKKVLDSLEEVALNYDELYELSQLSPPHFASVLTNLEICGLIESRAGLYYRK